MGPFDVDMRGLACLAEAALDAEMVVTVGAWLVRAGTDSLSARPRRRFAMARLAVTGNFGHERAERGTTATQPSRGSGVRQVCPQLRGKLNTPTFDLF